MARFQTFAKDIAMATAGIAPDKIQPQLVAFARSELAKVIASGEGSPDYNLFVNNAPATTEDNVVPPGPIIYQFNWWKDIVQFALQTLIDLSPELTGEYKNNWLIRADGQQVADPKDIQVASVVEITNDMPFHRSIVVGHKHYRIGHQNIEEARSKVMSLYGNFITARNTMIQLPDGYVMRGKFVANSAGNDKITGKPLRPYARRKLRPDVRKGENMTYPCLELRVKGL